jgi:hypothetical protein
MAKSVTTGWRKKEITQQRRKTTKAMASSVMIGRELFFMLGVVYVMFDNFLNGVLVQYGRKMFEWCSVAAWRKTPIVLCVYGWISSVRRSINNGS